MTGSTGGRVSIRRGSEVAWRKGGSEIFLFLENTFEGVMEGRRT